MEALRHGGVEAWNHGTIAFTEAWESTWSSLESWSGFPLITAKPRIARNARRCIAHAHAAGSTKNQEPRTKNQEPRTKNLHNKTRSWDTRDVPKNE